MGDRVRIIDKNGNAKFVSHHIASNEKLLKSYGYEIQHLPTDEVPEEAKSEEPVEIVPTDEVPEEAKSEEPVEKKSKKGTNKGEEK